MESLGGSDEVQILFCLETNQNADTDWGYIHETIEQFYVYRTVRLRPVYMGTKMNQKLGAPSEFDTVFEPVNRFCSMY